MARNTRSTTCSKDKKDLLDRVAKALGKEITEVVDMGIELVFQKHKRRIRQAERIQGAV